MSRLHLSRRALLLLQAGLILVFAAGLALIPVLDERSFNLQRIVFNLRGLPTRRDPLIWELGQRIRDIQQGPDGLLYALTDEDDGALLRFEPVR